MFKKKLGQEPSIEEIVIAYNSKAIESAFKLTQVIFDNSEKTINELEVILDKLHFELNESNFKKKIGLGPNENDREQWANLWGFYLGETLRNIFGGKWVYGNSEAPNIPCLELENSLCIFPTAKVFKRLENGKTDSISDYLLLIKKEFKL